MSENATHEAQLQRLLDGQASMAREQAALAVTVKAIDKTINGNGQPGLEDKLRKHVAERDEHAKRNLEQVALNVKTLADQTTKEQNLKLDVIGVRLNVLEKKVIWISAAATVLGVVGHLLFDILSPFTRTLIH